MWDLPGPGIDIPCVGSLPLSHQGSPTECFLSVRDYKSPCFLTCQMDIRPFSTFLLGDLKPRNDFPQVPWLIKFHLTPSFQSPNTKDYSILLLNLNEFYTPSTFPQSSEIMNPRKQRTPLSVHPWITFLTFLVHSIYFSAHPFPQPGTATFTISVWGQRWYFYILPESLEQRTDASFTRSHPNLLERYFKI